jgi:tetratricopeptide (TPR) repeat protein
VGTVLQALGKWAAARAQFEHALALDVTAAYALSNLCYGWRLAGNAPKAADACRQALQLQPGLESARNNLALTYEAAGDLPSALATLGASTDAARAAYNKGLLHLARREYRDALQSFDVARAERPRFREAEAIARQVRAHLREGNQP